VSPTPSAREPLDHAAARSLIDAFLVDDLLEADASRLEAHVKGCPACAAEIGGTTRLLALLGSLPTPPPAPDLDERIYAAAIADRARRHDHRSWLQDLQTQVFRGAVRTTGTLMVAIVTVGLLGGAAVLAAALLTQPAPAPSSRATVGTDMTPTPAPTMVQPTVSAAPSVKETPPAVVVTPAPTAKPVVTLKPSPSESASPAASSQPSGGQPSASPSPSASAEPSPTPTPSPSPSPTEKPRRTPPPTAVPLPTPAPSEAPSPTLP
jgi:anti-sigma factor RsiW